MRMGRGRAPTFPELVSMTKLPEERNRQHLTALRHSDFAKTSSPGDLRTLDVTKSGAAFVRELRGEEA